MTSSVWLRLGRISNLPTVWTNTLAAFALVGAKAEASSVALAALAMSFYYVAGMYLNDAFDRNIDAVERPTRPIPAGAVSAAAVFGAGFAMLGLGLAVTLWLAHRLDHLNSAWTSAVLLGTAIVGYDAYHKGNPVSPLLMALCRALVYTTVGLAVGGSLDPRLQLGALVLTAHLIGLTYAAKQETLARLESWWPLALLALPPICGLWLAVQQPLVLPFALALIGWTLHSLRYLWQPQRRSIPQAVVRLIAGICLVDAMLIAASGRAGLAFVAAAMLFLTRWAQRYIPGT